MNHRQQLPQPFFILAPMEAVTDVVFRHVVAEAGAPDVWFSEFTNATGWVHAGEKAIGGRLVKTDDERPIIAQIWGGEPGDMEQLAAHCRKLGYDGIDINMGCPAKSAVKSGGSALIRQPELAANAIAAAKTAGLPVSVKTRLGYTRVDEWRDWLTHLLRQDIVNLTIHLRTKKEMSKVPAHHELIDEIIALRDEIAPHTLLTINGDIRDRAHGLKLVEQHPGINGIMIGRGIFQNPFAFEQIPSEHSRDDLINLLHSHLNLYDQYAEQTGRPYDTIKRFYKSYIRGFDGASALRAALMLTTSTTAARQLLDNHTLHCNELEPRATPLYTKPMHNSIKAIVFDSDGTLIDTRRLIIEGYQTVLHRHNLEHLASESYIKQRLGKPVPETYEQIIAGHDVDVPIEQLVAEHDQIQNSISHTIKPYPYTEKLLREWKKAGIKLCLFTSGTRMMIRRNFAAIDIPDAENLFDAIITADDHIARKPEPDAIRQLLLDIDVLPENAVVVGDHPFDMIAAARARVGLKVGILHGFGTAQDLLNGGADFLCNELISLNHLMSFAE